MEESQSQNAEGSQRSRQARGNCQLVRTPFGMIVDRSTNQAQTPARTTTTSQNRPSNTTAATIPQPGYRPHIQGNTTNHTSRNKRMNPWVIRCCILIIVAIILAIAAGVVGLNHKAISESLSDHQSSSLHHTSPSSGI